MVAHRSGADPEFAGDFPGGRPSCHQAQDLKLSLREKGACGLPNQDVRRRGLPGRTGRNRVKQVYDRHFCRRVARNDQRVHSRANCFTLDVAVKQIATVYRLPVNCHLDQWAVRTAVNIAVKVAPLDYFPAEMANRFGAGISEQILGPSIPRDNPPARVDGKCSTCGTRYDAGMIRIIAYCRHLPDRGFC